MILKGTGEREKYGYSSNLMHAWDWFTEKRLSPYSQEHGHVDWNWLIDTIEMDFNNPTARAFVYGKFLEEIGSHAIR